MELTKESNMELTEDIIRKHAKLIEARVTVKAHTAHSKKGKAFNVKQHEREIGEKIRTILDKIKFNMSMPNFRTTRIDDKGNQTTSNITFDKAYSMLSKEDKDFLDKHWNGKMPKKTNG